jgi:magnesium chelatase family protein
MPALVGGGLRARPGEISLAHNGVLFLDEFPEFSGQVLDSLRQPLETGEVAISRANHRITYPARFMLVAAMNPCRCGRAGDPGFICKRGQNTHCAADYQGRLSGPLLDRIDLHIEVPAVTAADLILPSPGEGSREIAARVARARDTQIERYAALGLSNVRTNAQVSGPVLEEVARTDPAGMALLRYAADSMRLTARGYHRYCGSPERSPTSTLPSVSGACILQKPCRIARSPMTCVGRHNASPMSATPRRTDEKIAKEIAAQWKRATACSVCRRWTV